MYTLITVLLFITCILLILIVLVQNSKGGGLASNFQSTNQIMGVRKTTDFLEKATWTLVIALVVFSVAAVGFREGNVAADESEIKDVYQEAQQNMPSTANPGFGEQAGEQATPEEGQQ